MENKVYARKVNVNGVNVTEVSTPVLLLDETKSKYIKNFVKEVKMAEKANKYHMYTKIHMDINLTDTVKLSRVTEIKVTKSNLEVTFARRANDDGDVEYIQLSFPIKIIDSVSAEVR